MFTYATLTLYIQCNTAAACNVGSVGRVNTEILFVITEYHIYV